MTKEDKLNKIISWVISQPIGCFSRSFVKGQHPKYHINLTNPNMEITIGQYGSFRNCFLELNGNLFNDERLLDFYKDLNAQHEVKEQEYKEKLINDFYNRIIK